MSSSNANDYFMYDVWLRNHQFPPDDEDYEYPASLIIHAPSADKAREWGDYLSKRYCAEVKIEEFMWSSVELLSQTQWTIDDALCIEYGEDTSEWL
jgi:hypothetical protein